MTKDWPLLLPHSVLGIIRICISQGCEGQLNYLNLHLPVKRGALSSGIFIHVLLLYKNCQHLVTLNGIFISDFISGVVFFFSLYFYRDKISQSFLGLH